MVKKIENSWKLFWEMEYEKNKKYFGAPFSLNSRSYFQNILEQISTKAIRERTCAGFFHFISRLNIKKGENSIETWIHDYTPIRQIEYRNGSQQYQVVPAIAHAMQEMPGMLNPFWILKPRITPLYESFASAEIEYLNRQIQLLTQKNHSSPFTASTQVKSEYEVDVRLAKIAFNEFIKDRSIDKRDNLINAIYKLSEGGKTYSRTIFLQGGAPGLKK